ncbi:MAG: imidazolonepropionase [Acidobacteria bacterium]|nr:imidazolonepropionase [Acidobacteriota bacterium]
MSCHVFTGISRLITPTTAFQNAAMVVEQGKVVWLGRAEDCVHSGTTIDLGNRAVCPALVDCHTHLVYGGDRFGEYQMRAVGASYEEIMAAGGGIHSTVRATVSSSEEQLLESAVARAQTLIRLGTGTVEIKSGYGLEIEPELKMLRVIRALQDRVALTILPTLLAHVIPKGWERVEYLDMFCRQLMPEVKRQGLAQAVDVFCDAGAFTVAETRQILTCAQNLGFKIKVHAEQLTWTGASALVAELKGLSADHLEQTGPEDWAVMQAAGTVGTLLPGAAYILKKPFPPARKMWDAGLKLAIATDLNPGSSPMPSLFLALQMAMIQGGLSAEEAFLAGTVHAADALGLDDAGRLEVGSRADFLVVDHHDPYWPLYYWGAPHLHAVYLAGQLQE